MNETRKLILRLLCSKTSAAATPRNMAMWWGRPIEEIRAELHQLELEGIAERLPACRGRERIWVLKGSVS